MDADFVLNYNPSAFTMALNPEPGVSETATFPAYTFTMPAEITLPSSGLDHPRVVEDTPVEIWRHEVQSHKCDLTRSYLHDALIEGTGLKSGEDHSCTNSSMDPDVFDPNDEDPEFFEEFREDTFPDIVGVPISPDQAPAILSRVICPPVTVPPPGIMNAPHYRYRSFPDIKFAFPSSEHQVAINQIIQFAADRLCEKHHHSQHERATSPVVHFAELDNGPISVTESDPQYYFREDIDENYDYAKANAMIGCAKLPMLSGHMDAPSTPTWSPIHSIASSRSSTCRSTSLQSSPLTRSTLSSSNLDKFASQGALDMVCYSSAGIPYVVVPGLVRKIQKFMDTCHFSPSVLLMATYWISRLPPGSKLIPSSSYQLDEKLSQLLLTAVFIAHKVLDDHSYKNSAIAQANNYLFTQQINDHERRFLTEIDYNVYIQSNEWLDWLSSVHGDLHYRGDIAGVAKIEELLNLANSVVAHDCPIESPTPTLPPLPIPFWPLEHRFGYMTLEELDADGPIRKY